MTKAKNSQTNVNSLDNKNESGNIDTNLSESPTEKAFSNKSIPESSNKEQTSSNDEYTIDPISGEKYLKPKGESEYMGQRAWKLPPLRRDGFEIIWAITRGNELQNLVIEGWDFVDPNTPGLEQATPRHGGTDKEGKALWHRAMQMPKSRYDEMMARKVKANKDKENEIIFNPAMGAGKDFYLGKDHKAPTYTRNAGGMDPSMADAYNNSMR